MIAKDFRGTLRQLAPPDSRRSSCARPWATPTPDSPGSANTAEPQLRGILHDAGLTCVSSHFSIDELRKDQAGRIAWAKDVGLTQMCVPSLDGPKNPTMDDVKRAADEYNRMGERAAAAGIVQGLHNEDFELTKVDGQRTYDLLFQLLDPRYVKFQFQVSTISEGYDAAEYFTRYPGRFISMHVQGWSAKTRQIVPVGQGTLDWRRIFNAAKIRRHSELLRGDGLANDEGQRSLSSSFTGGVKPPVTTIWTRGRNCSFGVFQPCRGRVTGNPETIHLSDLPAYRTLAGRV